MINSMVLSCVLFLSTLLCLYTVVFAQNITSIISQSQYEEMLMHRNDPFCFANASYTYQDFVAAANFFPEFGTTGDNDTRKREVAAFFGQTSHLTNAGGPDSADGEYAWGYCFLPQVNATNFTDPFCDDVDFPQWPCAPGRSYNSRGPIALTYNYNYGAAGQGIRIDLLNNPDLVATNATISFMTAIWVWMNPQPDIPYPSSHDVITGQWTPSSADLAAGRSPGYGQIINIILGGTECGNGELISQMPNNIGYYKRYCDILQVGYGNNLDCAYNRTNLIPKVSIQLIGCTASVLNEFVY